MGDTIATIRLPPSLVIELKKISKEQHYVDLSELIRSVLRKKYEKSVLASSDMLSDSIISDIKKQTIQTSEAKLAQELLHIKKRLRDELK